MTKIVSFLTKKTRRILSGFSMIDIAGMVLFFLILVTAAAFFLRRSAFTYVTLQVSSGEDYFHNFWFYKPTDWYIQNLQIGMSSSDLLGEKNLELVDLYYYPTNTNEQSVFVTLKTKAVYNKRNQQYSYQGQPLLVGEHRIFKLGSVSIPGFIHQVSQTPKESNTKQVLVRGSLENDINEEIAHDAETKFYGIKNYLVEQIHPNIVIYNSKGEPTAKILEVKTNPGYREFIYQNYLKKVIDPDRTEVELLLDLTLQEVNGRFLYREEDRVLLGEKLILTFDNFSVLLTVEEILN